MRPDPVRGRGGPGEPLVSSEARTKLIRLLQLAFSGEKAAALAYQGHARSVKKPEERNMILKIERDEWIHREKVRELLAELKAKPLRAREIRASVVGHVLSFLCAFSGWFLPMYFAGKLETRNVFEYETAAGWAAELGLDHFIRELKEMADVEVEHEKYFLEIIGRPVPGRRGA